MSNTQHRHRYKNSGIDSQEMRRRREEEGIQLRKQKREQQLIKRRNVNLAQEDEPDSTVPVSSNIYLPYLLYLNHSLFLFFFSLG